jgi:hypothetical protein
VRGRVALLLLAAAIPLLILATAIVWQNYRVAMAAPLERVKLLRAGIAGRYGAVLGDAERLLTFVAAMPELGADGPAACRVLQPVLALRPDGIVNLAIFDAAGRVECSLGPAAAALADVANAEWFRVLRAGETVASVPGNASTQDAAAVVLVAVPRGSGAAFAGAVAGELRLDRLDDIFATLPGGGGNHAWLIDRNGGIIPLGAEAISALPDRAELSRLLNDQAPLLAARSRAGGEAAYAIARLGGTLHLLVGTDASADVAAARAILLRRLAGLMLLLGAGLAAVGGSTGMAQRCAIRSGTRAWCPGGNTPTCHELRRRRKGPCRA